MTLVMAAANRNFVVQVSDRRLTYQGTEGLGQVATDAENKSILWDFGHSRFFVSFTGLAMVASHSTEEFLCEAMLEAATEGAYDPEASVLSLTDLLSKWARARRMRTVPLASRRLTVMITGLSRLSGEAVPLQSLITNFQVWGSHDEGKARQQFDAQFWQPKPGEAWATLIQGIGVYHAVHLDEIERLRELLRRGKPPQAVAGKMIEMLPIWAARAEGLVGLQAHVSVMTADFSRPPTSTFVTETTSRSMPLTSTVVSRPDASFATRRGQITAEGDDAPPIVVPRVHPRQPCPCLSGRRYEDCHGRRQLRAGSTMSP